MHISRSLGSWASVSRPTLLLAATWALLAALYFCGCLLGLKLAVVHPSITAVWPGTGIALAAILVLGYRVWPGVFLGAFLVNLATAGEDGGRPSALACLSIACGNTLEGLLGAFLVNRFADGCQAFNRPRSIIQFVLLGALVSPLVSATVGTWSLGIALDHWPLPWATWWLGDAVGALIVAPPLILWSVQPGLATSRRHVLHGGAVALGLALIGLVLLGDWLMPHEPNLLMAFVCLPLVIWVAFVFGQRGIATVTLMLGILFLIGMLLTYGSPGADSWDQKMMKLRAQLQLQAFLGLTAVTGLTLAAVVAERDRSAADLRDAREKLERRVQERTADLARSNEALRLENRERQLAEQKFRDLLESAPDAKVIVNVHGMIVLVNAQTEKLFGYSRHDLLGQPVELLVPVRLRSQHQEHRRHYFQEPGFRPMGMGMKLFGRHKDGSEFPVEISLSLLKTEEGILVSSAIRDITARQETEEKLRQAERLAAVGEMIAGLAHESRNALQQSQACLELLALKVANLPGGKPDIAGLVADVQKAQDHLHYLYEEVRGYAAPIKLHLQRTDLGRLLADTWDQLALARQGRQVRLVQKAPALDLRCNVDPQAMHHVLRNILENSLHACPDPVLIQTTFDDAKLKGRPALRLSLADNGPGLSPEARKKLFEPFFTTKIQGTGLGLATTRRIVEAHQGSITVTGKDNQGMEIVITLPRQV